MIKVRDGLSYRSIEHSQVAKLALIGPGSEMSTDWVTIKISFLIYLAWAEGGIDVGDPTPKIEKCCEGVHDPPTPARPEN